MEGAALAVVFLLVAFMGKKTMNWKPPKTADPYLSEIQKAEKANNLPDNLLARVLYQESRYRQDIITGELKSSAGAVGIAQIVPRWHPNVNPLDPVESIHYAAGYLRSLYKRFGNWPEALAAYNWGQGNVSRKGLAAAPLETRNYYAQILADVVV